MGSKRGVKAMTSKGDLRNIISTDGLLPHITPAICGEYSYEFIPGHQVTVRIAADGTVTFAGEDGEHKYAFHSCTGLLRRRAGRVAVPALLWLMGELKFRHLPGTTADEDARTRISFARGVLYWFSDPLDVRTSYPIPSSVARKLSGEEILILGTIPRNAGPGGLRAEERLKWTRVMQRRLRDGTLLPWGGFPRAYQAPPAMLLPAGMMPEEYAMLCLVLGPNLPIRNHEHLPLLLDVLAFAGSEDAGAGMTFREFRDGTPLEDKVAAVAELLESGYRVSYLAGAPQQRERWWATVPGDMLPGIDGLTRDQLVAFASRAAACVTEAGVRRSLMMAVAGYGPFAGDDPAYRDVRMWCADLGAADWIRDELTRFTGNPHHARDLLAEIEKEAGELGLEVTMGAWDRYLGDFEGMSAMPVSWWLTLEAAG